MIEEFQIKRYEPAYVQITQHLREQILGGALVPGSRLPPIQQMAKQFGTNYRTVHVALTPLVKEGLVVRIHGSGTFVRKRSAKLACTGIYFSADLWRNTTSGYYQALSSCLQKAFAAREIKTNIWMDSRSEEKQVTVLPALMQAIEQREIQSLIIGMVPPLAVSPLERLPIPTCFLGGAVSPTTGANVCLDLRQMVHVSVGELRRLGCRTVGLITHQHTKPNERDRAFERQMGFFEEFLAATRAHGVQTRNKWIIAPESPHEATERFGYEEFKKLWNQAERPEGLLIFPDVMARGVVAACIELGINIPRDLKLVFHRNAEVEFLCPLPVSWIEASATQIAETAVEHLLKQFRGEAVRPVMLPFHLYRLGEQTTA